MNEETRKKISESARKQKRNLKGQFQVDTTEVKNFIAGLLFVIFLLMAGAYFVGRWQQHRQDYLRIPVSVVSPLSCDHE